MKKFHITHILFALFVCFSACSSKQGVQRKEGANVLLQGNIANAGGKTIFVEELKPQSANILDSLHTEENGNFSSGIHIPQAGFYRLRIADNNFFNLIIFPDDSIHITADAGNMDGTYQIKGSDESQRLKDLNLFFQKIYRSNDSLNTALQRHQQNNDANNYTSAVQFQQQLSGQYHAFVKNFIDAKPASLASLAAVQNLDAETNFDYYAKVEVGLKTILPKSSYYNDLKAKVEDMQKLAIGSEAPEIILKNTEDKKVSLSSLRGKVVLIDFWASWCRPCRAENPNVVKLYKKYHEKGFEVFSVSLDKSKQAWLNAIQQDGLIWKNHLSDLGYWNSAVVPLYKIQGIPLTFLIDKEGKIIGKNLRGAQLEQKLEEVFLKQ